MRRTLLLAALALALYGISQSPVEWADTASILGDHAAEAFRGFGTFLRELAT